MGKASRKKKARKTGQDEFTLEKILARFSKKTPGYRNWKRFCLSSLEANHRGWATIRTSLRNNGGYDPRLHATTFLSVYSACVEGVVSIVTDHRSAEDYGERLEECLNDCIKMFEAEFQYANPPLTPEECRVAVNALRWDLQSKLDLGKADALKAALQHDDSGPFQTALGRNIEKLRNEAGWSIDDLANWSGIHKTSIIGHRHGKSAYPNTIKKYAETFSKKLCRAITVKDMLS